MRKAPVLIAALVAVAVLALTTACDPDDVPVPNESNVDFDTPALVQKYLDENPYPGMALVSADEFQALYGTTCSFFPPSAVGPSIQDPVVSDTPALLFIEWLDTQTPRTWGRLAAESLSNSHVVDWRSEGHVIAKRSPDGCAGSIAAAFVADPSTAPDASCASGPAYTLKFIGPDVPIGNQPKPSPSGG